MSKNSESRLVTTKDRVIKTAEPAGEPAPAAQESRVSFVTVGALQVAAGVAMGVLLAFDPDLGSRAVAVFVAIAAAVFIALGIATVAVSGRPRRVRLTMASIAVDAAVAVAAIIVVVGAWRQITLAGGYLGLGVIVAAAISALAIGGSAILE